MDPEPCPPPRSRLEIFKLIKECVIRLNHPKIIPKPPKIVRNRGTMSADRIAQLSVPRYKYIKPSQNPRCWEYKLKHPVQPGALTYTASARIVEMAVQIPSKVYIKPENNPSSWEYIMKHRIPPSALKFLASEHLIALSKQKPWRITKKFRRRRRPKSSVSKKALQAKASKRVLGLAKPHIKPNPGDNEFAFKVNPKALHYKITARVKRLAQPKPLITKIKERPSLKKKK